MASASSSCPGALSASTSLLHVTDLTKVEAVCKERVRVIESLLAEPRRESSGVGHHLVYAKLCVLMDEWEAKDWGLGVGVPEPPAKKRVLSDEQKELIEKNRQAAAKTKADKELEIAKNMQWL